VHLASALTRAAGFRHCTAHAARARRRFFPALQLQLWVDSGRIDAAQPVTMKTLMDAGLVSKAKYGIKLLGTVRASAR
jgi:hypothetical protein